MNVIGDAQKAMQLGKKLVDNRRAHMVLRQKVRSQPPLEPERFKIAVYFADEAVNMYQIRQWYKPLLELAKTWPVLILSRGSTAALQLFDESPLPVTYVRTVADLEKTVARQDIRIVFYVNQNAKNFQMFRYGQRWHVFINHGESDKMYMTTNQFKAYDYSLIAGEAARARLERVLWDYDFDKRALPIGRPQADHFSGALPYTPDERIVVLYAPTWEGDRAAAAYGSIASHGVGLVRALLATGRHRVIYRPHPRSGIVNNLYGQANREIIGMLAAANKADPTAQHVFDNGSEIGWQIAAADVAISDISAMIYDRLATGKPLMVTRPVSERAKIDAGGYLSACEWLEVDDVAEITEQIDRLLHDPETVERIATWSQYYFGDTTPGTATKRFHDTVQHLMDQWAEHARIHEIDLAERTVDSPH
ncbi:CDP-glycerol glycerophosphotransferase family protein [Paramicrobacterium chengjingii]|uniref:CDP-glycerol glycerophosphotransferase family protein n=1 Tax=Paramicrobacterium chengjingii TaxID=2769067 RepID=A0ABX6YLX4_9MICO|nr:CDP-glycerol glycerophosphotransferase family protein [Microbacterium chengjingii]QPZ39670.1 CDP-glycerol glycerophosphotransferase family protein [Microbacterium chengjingii]